MTGTGARMQWTEDIWRIGLDDSPIVESEGVSPGSCSATTNRTKWVSVDVLHLCKRSCRLNLSAFQFETT